MAVAPTPEKICASCGRPFAWRRKWARSWDEVRYCSDACRGSSKQAEKELDSLVLAMARSRGAGTICPSEAARAIDEAHWRAHMEPVRRAARRLAERGLVDVTQEGRMVDPSSVRGPIRIKARPT